MFSTVIIARNEEQHIEKCIVSAKQVSNDIILIDSGSSDRTMDLAKELGARVYSYGWNGYGANKNYGASLAKNDWILSLDGDEVLSDELIFSLAQLTPMDNHVYKLNSLVNYQGQWIRHSGWYPRWKHRIFNRNECKWNDAHVHEDLEPLSNKTIAKLKGDILHYSYSSQDEHKQKVIDYADLKALQWIRNDIKPSVFKKYIGPPFKFLKAYLLQAGFLDGKKGYFIARMNALQLRRQIKRYYHYKKHDAI